MPLKSIQAGDGTSLIISSELVFWINTKSQLALLQFSIENSDIVLCRFVFEAIAAEQIRLWEIFLDIVRALLLSIQHYSSLPYIASHSLHLHKCNCNYTTLLTLHHNYNSTTATTTAALDHTAPASSCGWGDLPVDHCNHWNHFRTGLSLPSRIQDNCPPL